MDIDVWLENEEWKLWMCIQNSVGFMVWPQHFERASFDNSEPLIMVEKAYNEQLSTKAH